MIELDARNKIDGKKIVMYINDVRVEGEFIRRERHEMTVAITSPFSGLSQSAGHIMVIARGVIHWDGERGERKAYYLLSSMYHLMSGIDGQEQKLRLYMNRFRKEKDAKLNPKSPEMRKIKKLKKEGASYKAQMKAGEITSVKYGQLIQPLNKEIKAIEFDIERHLYDFFDNTFEEFLEQNGTRVTKKTFIAFLVANGVIWEDEKEYLKELLKA